MLARKTRRLPVLKTGDFGCVKWRPLTNACTFSKGDVSSNWCLEYQDYQKYPIQKSYFRVQIFPLFFFWFFFLQLLFIKFFLRETFSTVWYTLHSNISHCHHLHPLHLHTCPYLFWNSINGYYNNFNEI